MTATRYSAPSPTGGRGLRLGLWIVQLLLAMFFCMAGVTHGIKPLDEAAKMATWIPSVPPALVRFIGYAELAGALGLVVPAATRIMPVLTPWAAVGLATIMLLAVPFHIMRGETNVIGLHIVVAALAAFVAWGRFNRAPIAPSA